MCQGFFWLILKIKNKSAIFTKIVLILVFFSSKVLSKTVYVKIHNICIITEILKNENDIQAHYADFG